MRPFLKWLIVGFSHFKLSMFYIYLLSLSDVPLVSTLVSAPYSGCMDVRINGHPVDLDQAVHKHNDIRSHSCPLLDSLQWPEFHTDCRERWFPICFIKALTSCKIFLDWNVKELEPELGAWAQNHPVLLLWCCLQGISALHNISKLVNQQMSNTCTGRWIGLYAAQHCLKLPMFHTLECP